MHLFSADTTMFLILFIYPNLFLFSNANLLKSSPNLNSCSINISHRGTSLYWLCVGQKLSTCRYFLKQWMKGCVIEVVKCSAKAIFVYYLHFLLLSVPVGLFFAICTMVSLANFHRKIRSLTFSLLKVK